MDSSSVAIEELLRWAKEQGADYEALQINDRSFQAKQDIISGECFLRTPQKLLLYSGLALKADYEYNAAFKTLIKDRGPLKDDRYILVLLILLERGRGGKSFWAPYINALPLKFDDPCWWSDDDIKILQGTRLGTGTERLLESIQDLCSLRDDLLHHCRCKVGRFRHRQHSDAHLQCVGDGTTLYPCTPLRKSLVFTGLAPLTSAGGSEDGINICLCPVSDLLDHNASRHVAWHTGPDGQDDFQFITFTPTSKGSTMYSNYGNKSNEELILGYGFDLEDNAADFFHVSLSHATQNEGDVDEVCRQWQSQALIHKIGLPHDHYLRKSNPLPPSLIAAASVHIMPDCLRYELLAQPEPDTGHRSSERGDNKRQRPNELEFSKAWHKGSEDFRVEVDGTPSDAVLDSVAGHSEPLAAPRLPLPPATQLKVLGLLRQQLTKKRSEISGGDPREDRELAGSQARTSHARMALTYRASQKEIIEQCLEEISQEMSALLLKVTHAMCAVQFEDSGNAAVRSMEVAQLAVNFHSHVSLVDAPLAALETSSSSHAKLDQIMVKSAGADRIPSLTCNCKLEKGQILAECSREAMVYAAGKPALICKLVTWVATDTSLTAPAEESMYQDCLRYVALPFAIEADNPLLQGLSLASDFQEEIEHMQEVYDSLPTLETPLWSTWTEGQRFKVFLWAYHVVDVLGFTIPSGVAVIPAIGCLQNYIGRAISLYWLEDGGTPTVLLKANCALDQGTILSQKVFALGQPADEILSKYCLQTFATLYNAQQGSVSLSRDLGSRWLQQSYEIGLDAPPDDPCGPVKQQILQACALGHTHHLSQHTNPRRFLAAVAVICSSEASLAAIGSQQLLESYACEQTVAPRMEGVAGPGVRKLKNSEREPFFKQQQDFIERLLQDPKIVKEARKALKAILSASRSSLKEPKVAAPSAKGAWQSMVDYKWSLREGLSRLSKQAASHKTPTSNG